MKAFVAARERGDLTSMRAIAIAAIAGNSGRATAIVKDVVRLAPNDAPKIIERTMKTFPQLANRIKGAAAPPVEAKASDVKPPTPEQTVVKKIEESEDENPYGKWSGETTVGGSYTSGTQKSLTTNLSFLVKQEIGKWRNKGDVSFDYGRVNNVTTAQSLDVNAQTRRDITDRFYGYGLGEYEDNRFSGFDYQITEGLGVGYKVIDEPTVKLNLEGGPGLRHSKISATDEVKTEGLVRLAGLFNWDISDSATLSNETALLVTGNSFEIVSDASGVIRQGSDTTNTTALDLKIISSLAARISYEIHYRSDPPEEGASTESVAKVSLVHSF